MRNSPDDIPAESAAARSRLLGAWAGELAKGRARVARIERARDSFDSVKDDSAVALEELRLTYEELSVAEEEMRVQNEQLRHAQFLIEQDRARYRELFHHSPIPYLTTNADGTITDANLAASRLVRCRSDRMQRKPLVVFTRGASRRRVRLAIDKLTAGPNTLRFRMYVTSREGEVARVHVTAAAVHDLDGVIQEIRWQLVDEEPERRRERARKRRSQQLEAVVEQRTSELARAQRLKDQLIATVSHELRTPLTAIGGYSDILSTGLRGPLNMEQLGDVERIHRAYEHMVRVVDDLLSYSRISAGRLSLEITDASLGQALQAVMELIAPQAGEKDITLTVAEAPPSLVLRVDPERLRQILLNVIGNAIKFTPRGGRVMLRSITEETAAVVEVEDTGPGIPPSLREAIFEPFVRLSTEHKTPGVGLGLAISREMARAMGGDLTVYSEQGVGSTFALRMPRSTSLAGQNSPG